LLDTGDPQDKVLIRGTDHKFTYGYRSEYKMLKKHKPGEYISFHGLLDNQQKFTLIEDQTFLHGLLMTLSWYILADISILIKQAYFIKYRIIIHGVLFSISTIISVTSIL
jgi:hypothetical protein